MINPVGELCSYMVHTRRRNRPRRLTVPCMDDTGGRSSRVAICFRSGSLFQDLYLINLLICHFILQPPCFREPFWIPGPLLENKTQSFVKNVTYLGS